MGYVGLSLFGIFRGRWISGLKFYNLKCGSWISSKEIIWEFVRNVVF